MSGQADRAVGPARADGTVARGEVGRPPVVVVGLGPVGATAALLLARAGVRVVAIERDLEVYPHPRAVALDDDALRVLQAAGVRDGDGLDLLPGGAVRIRGRRDRTLVELGPPPTTTGHPGLAFFRQPQLERTLRERLEHEPLVDLRLGTTVVGVASTGGARAGTPGGRGRSGARRGGHGRRGTGDDDRGSDAVLRVAGPDGAASDLRAAWVLACDGGRSSIRTMLGIRLRGLTSPSRWLVVDTDALEDPAPTGSGARDPGPASPPTRGAGPRGRGPAPFAPADFEFGADPAGPWVHGPLPGGAHRWEFLLDPAADRALLEDPAVAHALLARRLPGPGRVPAVRRSAVYAFHVRVAERWRVGRVLLLGDAAHLAPPFAGQGLCAGLRDAGNVAWKVAAAWHGTASPRLLDSYATERRPHVLRTTALAAALGAVVELRRPRAAAARDAVLARLAATVVVRRWIAAGGWRPPATLRRGLLATAPRHRHLAGTPLPQPLVGAAPGPPVTAAELPLDDVLPAGWVLLGAADAGPVGRRLGIAAVPLEGLGDGGTIAAALAPATVALVRPDRVIYGTATARDVDALLAGPAASAAFSP